MKWTVWSDGGKSQNHVTAHNRIKHTNKSLKRKIIFCLRAPQMRQNYRLYSKEVQEIIPQTIWQSTHFHRKLLGSLWCIKDISYDGTMFNAFKTCVAREHVFKAARDSAIKHSLSLSFCVFLASILNGQMVQCSLPLQNLFPSVVFPKATWP